MKTKTQKKNRKKKNSLAANMAACAHRLKIDTAILRVAKSWDCPGFRPNGSIDVEAVKDWLDKHPEARAYDPANDNELSKIRVERERDKARLDKMEADKMEGLLIEKRLVSVFVTRFLLAEKFRLLAMPKKLAQRLAIETDPINVEQILMAEAREILGDGNFEYGLMSCPHCGKAAI